MTGTFEAAWYADPYGRHEARYFDGRGWTEHVSNAGLLQVDPPGGGGTIFTEPVLVVNQKARVYEFTNEYGIFDQAGRPLGAVREITQPSARKGLRLLTTGEQYLARLQVLDEEGNLQLTLTRPVKFGKPRVIVGGPTGREMGALVHQNGDGSYLTVEVAENPIGSIRADSGPAGSYTCRDGAGGEIGRITKTLDGLVPGRFPTAENHVVRLQRGVPDPLHRLVVAAGLCVDTALRVDAG